MGVRFEVWWIHEAQDIADVYSKCTYEYWFSLKSNGIYEFVCLWVAYTIHVIIIMTIIIVWPRGVRVSIRKRGPTPQALYRNSFLCLSWNKLRVPIYIMKISLRLCPSLTVWLCSGIHQRILLIFNNYDQLCVKLNQFWRNSRHCDRTAAVACHLCA